MESDQQHCRLLEKLLEGLQEPCGHRAIDDAVIEAEVRGHLPAHGQLVVADDRLLDRGAAGEDRAVGRIDDRREVVKIVSI